MSQGSCNVTREEIKNEIQKRDPRVVYVLGGPGAGKGTQCSLLQQNFPIRHLSAGELLRQEMADESSPHRELIDYYIREGLIVPAEITVFLLGKAMVEDKDSKLFLIDGFPRAIEQYETFCRVLGTGYDRFMLFLDCPDEEMVRRIMKRANSSGRTDDNIESVKKRLQVYHDQTENVKRYFDRMGKLVVVNANSTETEIHENIKKAINPVLVEVSAEK